MTSQIEAVWEDLLHNNERPVFRRVDEAHRLDLYAGIDVNDDHILMLVTPEEPPAPPTYDTITVSCRRRADANWALLIELHNKDLAIPFARLCQDLIDSSRECQHGGPTLLINRLARWRRLMELAKNRALSEPALRGLLGELIILKDAIAPRFGNDAAVNGWVGPHDAPQDFLVAGIAIEVKTCAPTATSITISSLEQLDANTSVLLATVLLTPSSQNQQGAFTPTQLVETIRNQVGENNAVRAEFDLRLAEAGYEDLREYTAKWYQCDGTRYYRVFDDFPRLTTTTVPPGIAAATYDVTVASCAPYLVTENEPWT
jgi:hypothetical protein